MSRRAARYAKNHTAAEEREEQVSSSPSESANDAIPFETPFSQPASKIIDVFTNSFEQVLLSPDLEVHIQSVKADLYNRDYLAAFGNDDKRFAYACRWSPARALSYSSLFAYLEPVRALFQDSEKPRRVLCIGGGASSEVVGLAAVFCKQKQDFPVSASNLHIDVVDIADWSSVVTHLTNFVSSKWLYDASKLSSSFLHQDILGSDSSTMHYSDMDLLTLLFTTNELFCEKRTETIKFLQSLNRSCKLGALLLIAESAGSYSHITIGTKKFPVQFLIDTVLTGKPGANDGAWEIVLESDSCWYRVNPKAVQYQMKLENMRFFYRLFRKK